MATINLTLVNIAVMDDGNYSVQVAAPGGDTYTVKLTAAQCASLASIQTAVSALAQPLKFKGQQITITI